MDLEEVVPLFSYNPIKKYADITKKGSIKVGKDADFVAITDDYQAIQTYVEGRKVYDCEVDKDLFNPEFIRMFKVD